MGFWKKGFTKWAQGVWGFWFFLPNLNYGLWKCLLPYMGNNTILPFFFFLLFFYFLIYFFVLYRSDPSDVSFFSPEKRTRLRQMLLVSPHRVYIYDGNPWDLVFSTK